MEKQELGPLQTKWVEFLEAHPELQTEGYLERADGTMCCLGVVCNILGINKQLKDDFVYFDNGENEKENAVLPDSAVDKFKFYSVEGLIKNTELNDYYCLTSVNDNGTTWPEIAKFVRENPSAVFSEPA